MAAGQCMCYWPKIQYTFMVMKEHDTQYYQVMVGCVGVWVFSWDSLEKTNIKNINSCFCNVGPTKQWRCKNNYLTFSHLSLVLLYICKVTMAPRVCASANSWLSPSYSRRSQNKIKGPPHPHVNGYSLAVIPYPWQHQKEEDPMGL